MKYIYFSSQKEKLGHKIKYIVYFSLYDSCIKSLGFPKFVTIENKMLNNLGYSLYMETG